MYPICSRTNDCPIILVSISQRLTLLIHYLIPLWSTFRGTHLCCPDKSSTNLRNYFPLISLDKIYCSSTGALPVKFISSAPVSWLLSSSQNQRVPTPWMWCGDEEFQTLTCLGTTEISRKIQGANTGPRWGWLLSRRKKKICAFRNLIWGLFRWGQGSVSWWTWSLRKDNLRLSGSLAYFYFTPNCFYSLRQSTVNWW